MTTEIPTSNVSNEKSSAKWIIAGIMLALTVWGSYLGRGAYLKQQDTIKGWVILLCVLAFLAFWGIMLVSQKRRTANSQYSVPSIAGFVMGLIAVVLAIPMNLSFGSTQLDLSQPGIPAVISLGLLGVSIVLSIIGLSRPQARVGKNLGLLAFPFAIVWFCLRFAAGS